MATSQQGGAGVAKLLGSACSGVLELGIFHPIDTITKRLMSNTTPIFATAASQPTGRTAVGVGGALANLNGVIFRDAAAAPALTRYRSLFPGLGYAAGYKVLQRTYKYTAQAHIAHALDAAVGGRFQDTFGERNAKPLVASLAGSVVGVGEVLLLPLDVLKIKAQTNPDALKGRNLFGMLLREGRGLYRGAGWTAARNAPGSFALFGASATVKERVFGLTDYRDATFSQNFIASIAGAAASITVSAPLDVVKTRIQSRPFDSPESGREIVGRLLRTEGPGAFFKGLIPKLVVVGPKLVFSYTVAMTLISHFERVL